MIPVVEMLRGKLDVLAHARADGSADEEGAYEAGKVLAHGHKPAGEGRLEVDLERHVTPERDVMRDGGA